MISYPIVDSPFGVPAIRGKEAVADFSARFCRRWSHPQITTEDAVQDGNRVLLVWEFEAVGPASDADVETTEPPVRRWDGITCLRFDDQGLVSKEIGEASEHLPAARIGGRP